MNTINRKANQSQSTRDPADLAPHVERTWADAFVIEQRLLGVPGDHIGDALVTVEAHVAESGESAEEAFGDATAYAREIAAGRDPGGELSAATVASAVVGLVGVLVISHTTRAWLAGGSADLTVGALLGLGLVVAALGVLLIKPAATLRLILSKFWVGAILLALPVFGSVAAMILLPAVVLTVPALVLGALGALLVGAAALLTYLDGTGTDPVLAPGETVSRRSSGRALQVLAMPLAALVVVAFTWAINALA
ncbi:MAG: hypothetical protein WAQ75_10690 [Propionicimonas sp.]